MADRAAPSRPSLHNSTAPPTGDSDALRRAALREPITTRDSFSLRAECWNDGGDELLSWREIVWEWRDAVEDNRDRWGTFRNQDGEEFKQELGDRFTEEKWEQRYAQLHDFMDGVRSRYGRDMTVALVSLSASSTDDRGQPRPPVDHFADLEASKDAVNTALSRDVAGDLRYERIAIPDQHESGYIHWHWAVAIDGDVPAEGFQPMIDAHVRNCPSAEHAAHEILPDDPEQSAVSVREDVENIPAYLTAYTLGNEETFQRDPLDAPEDRQMMLALLWATNSQYWRPSNGAQDMMKYADHDLPDWWATLFERWELVGLHDGRDGELQEVDPSVGGGVTMFETSIPPPD